MAAAQQRNLIQGSSDEACHLAEGKVVLVSAIPLWYVMIRSHEVCIKYTVANTSSARSQEPCEAWAKQGRTHQAADADNRCSQGTMRLCKGLIQGLLEGLASQIACG